MLIDDWITLFIGGTETTASTLGFCLLELGQNPKVLECLKEEVTTVIGSKVNISIEDVNRLEYTTAVIKETLRLWPPFPNTVCL